MFKKDLTAGFTHTKTIMVNFKDTAAAFGSGSVEVFATPALISLMEGTALEGVQPFLTDDYTTVGIDVCVKHIKATPVGMKVTCKAVLTDVDGARLTFEVEAKDEEGKIGYGTHKRFVINLPEFMEKAGKKA
jgi:predicted thioesterase